LADVAVSVVSIESAPPARAGAGAPPRGLGPDFCRAPRGADDIAAKTSAKSAIAMKGMLRMGGVYPVAADRFTLCGGRSRDCAGRTDAGTLRR
jgi:hypothetical protein